MFKSKEKLPEGWRRKQSSYGGRLYLCDAESLRVERLRGEGVWRLFHKDKDTGFRFKTAGEAVEHAQDARMGG